MGTMKDFQIDEFLFFLCHRKDAEFILEKFSARIFKVPRIRGFVLSGIEPYYKTKQINKILGEE
jgi:hypothetical protein